MSGGCGSAPHYAVYEQAAVTIWSMTRYRQRQEHMRKVCTAAGYKERP